MGLFNIESRGCILSVLMLLIQLQFNQVSTLEDIKYQVQAVVGSPHCKLGEAPHWDDKNQALFFVDIYGDDIHRYTPNDGSFHTLHLGQNGSSGPILTSFAFPSKSKDVGNNSIIVSQGNQIKLIEWDGSSPQPQSMKTLHTIDLESPDHKFNDGKLDAKGRLWAGTMNSKRSNSSYPNSGTLYKFDENWNFTAQLSKIELSNGLTWSQDNGKFYYIDSQAYSVYAFDFELESGNIYNQSTIFDYKKEDEPGRPDGVTIDTDGNLWVASVGGAKILKIDPIKGDKLGEIKMPVDNPTSLTFGGKELSTLYVTTASSRDEEKRKAQPEGGLLFEIKGLGVQGFSI